MTKGTDLFREAKHEDRDLDEVQERASRANPRVVGLPTTWSNQDGSVNLAGHASVHVPTPAEVKEFSEPPRATCGSCRYFEHSRGRDMMINQQVAERLVREQEWQLKHFLTAPPDSMGVCGAGDGDTATSIVTKCCDQYRPRAGKTGRWRPGLRCR